VSEKYEFIDAQEVHYPIRSMCRWAGVSTSGSYDWPGPARLGGAPRAARS
jgi:hypothetical protein